MFYFDNASTTKQKFEILYKTMSKELIESCSPSRGGYTCSLNSSRKLYNSRKAIAELFNFKKVRNVVFTPGATWSLNTAILGLLKEGDHVVTTGIEHNAVMRPLAHLEKARDVNISYAKHDNFGRIDLASIEKIVNKNTKAIIINHASNVNGVIMPLEEISIIAKQHGLYFIVDAAQTAGFLDIDLSQIDIDVLAFTGHKALMGPPGTGGMVLSDRAANDMNPLIYGGTGSSSESIYQPINMPDKFESGTSNFPGFISLGASVRKILDIGLDKIRSHEYGLLDNLKNELFSLENITILQDELNDFVPTISIIPSKIDVNDMSFWLSNEYNIMARSGLHCAPNAHKTLNSYVTGTLRFSLGYFNTDEEIKSLVSALKEIMIK
jgi:cysteine desulfurase family protein